MGRKGGRLLSAALQQTGGKGERMRKPVGSRDKPRGKNDRAGSVNRLLKSQKLTASDTAFDLVQVYESVERSYRAAAMACEAPAGMAFSTNY